MSKLSWVTAPGTIANLLVGINSAVILQAIDTANTGSELTYNIISGALPNGLTLTSDGKITGAAIYSNPLNNYFSTSTYEFIVRVSSSDGVRLDGGFSIIITNNVNNDFSWITPAGALGTVQNNEYYSLQIQAYSPTSTAITYSLVSGQLPAGMRILPTGFLQGVPTFLHPITVNQSESYKFTVRATNSYGHICDRSFSLTVTNVTGPIIEPSTTLLGAFFDGTYYTQQLTVFESNPNVQVQWSVKDGELPPGITLSNNGLLSGYIQPIELVGQFGPAGFDGVDVVDGVVTQQQEYDLGPFDFNQLNQSLSYSFTIQAYDGANYDLQSYVIEVVSRGGFTADSTNLVNDTYLTVDARNTYIPVLRNSSTILPTGRQNSYYAFKFDGYDFAGDEITYALANTIGAFDTYVSGIDTGFDHVPFDSFNPNTASTTNLPGLFLDSKTGWLYGKIDPQAASLQNFQFGVQVDKVVDSIKYSSQPIFFTLPVLGDINNIVEWVSSSNLGTIDNGSVSELSVKAISPIGTELIYSLYDYRNVPAALPQGLTLLSNGDISGRASFEAFCIDDYATTIDGDRLTFDRTYTFTVKAETPDGAAYSYQEFTLKLNIIDTEPYENLYLRAMPKFDQRQIYNSIINDPEIFNPALIYRPTDPWFGIHKDIEMLFLPGLNSKTLDEYKLAIEKNHWTKTYNFDGIGTAVVLDDNYNIKYEVVYVNIIDPGENLDGTGPTQTLDLSSEIANPYIDSNGIEHKVVYPNTSSNMIDRLVQGIDYNDQSSLPPWMTSNQPDTTTANKFQPPLGFTKAVVLAYTVPGASKLIAYRLKASGLNFSGVEFTVDRYFVDDYYSGYYNPTTLTYTGGAETTFDRLPTNNVGSIVARVNFAVTVPYNEINGRPVSYINSHGGIDGRTNYQTGDTIIFIQQEGFLNPGPYDGWVNYTDAWIGDDINTTAVEGYGVEGYDTYELVPGYLEKIQGTAQYNQRGGVWQIDIINGIVKLNFIQEIAVNERVQILNGKSYSSSIMYYTPIINIGQTVPYYIIYQVTAIAIKQQTTFNAGTTKFFSNRDQYYEPGTQDKYLSFPQHGVFN
ncbi:hypothetical protein UFOVP112_407 [uncultured Caudovirales phage]|uniref:Ig n=1 Tax=uncultured Caudovirales phage TaxID=2100421 RepID=A0A6J5LC82_9CAUD|nr:hypothetical protein UFOVP112_407 [uncultured Caudovirales phage]